MIKYQLIIKITSFKEILLIFACTPPPTHPYLLVNYFIVLFIY